MNDSYATKTDNRQSLFVKKERKNNESHSSAHFYGVGEELWIQQYMFVVSTNTKGVMATIYVLDA